MRRVLVFLALAILWAMPANAQDPNVPFASSAVEFFFTGDYKALKSRKALAIGPRGVYGWGYGARSDKEARRLALSGCQSVIPSVVPGGGKGLKCMILAVNDRVVINDPWVGPPIYTPAAGEDGPLEHGLRYRSKISPVRGVVLHVHGCDGIGSRDVADAWGGFFTTNGFEFFIPDSFWRTRLPPICGDAYKNHEIEKTRIIKMRIGETLRSIARLQKRYPGLPIYVWGHSEGSAVVQYLRAEVAGIIASGDECGISGHKTGTPRSVPVLFLFGDHDPYLEGFKIPVKAKDARKCRNLVRSKGTQVTIVKDSAHGYFPWRPEIHDAMLAFLGVKSGGLPKPALRKGVNLSGQALHDFQRYKNEKNNKAFAASKFGDFGWSAGWDYLQDAEQHALFLCTKAAKLDYFKLKINYCEIVDRDGKQVK